MDPGILRPLRLLQPDQATIISEMVHISMVGLDSDVCRLEVGRFNLGADGSSTVFLRRSRRGRDHAGHDLDASQESDLSTSSGLLCS